MIRYVAVLRRRQGTTSDEFLRSWLGEHRELARALPHVRRVEFLPAAAVEGFAQDFDGVGFLDFDTPQDLRAGLASEQAMALRTHTATFADTDSVVRLVVDASASDGVVPPA